MPSYSVTVATGNQWFAGTDDYIYLTLVGLAGTSERHLLDKPFYNDFERGAVSEVVGGLWNITRVMYDRFFLNPNYLRFKFYSDKKSFLSLSLSSSSSILAFYLHSYIRSSKLPRDVCILPQYNTSLPIQQATILNANLPSHGKRKI